MIDPISLLAIGASIAAIISGFRDSRSLFGKWLRKRREKRLAQHEDLDAALERGGTEVEKGQNEGHARFGSRFLQGDSKQATLLDGTTSADLRISGVSRLAIVDVLIRMNEGLIAALRTASAAASNIDPSVLTSVARSTRHDTVGVLGQLMQRMAVRSRIRKFPSTVEQGRRGGPSYAMRDRDVFPESTWAPEPSSRRAKQRPAQTPAEGTWVTASFDDLPFPAVDTVTGLRSGLPSVSDLGDWLSIPTPSEGNENIGGVERRPRTSPIPLPMRTSGASVEMSSGVLARAAQQARDSDAALAAMFAGGLSGLGGQGFAGSHRHEPTTEMFDDGCRERGFTDRRRDHRAGSWGAEATCPDVYELEATGPCQMPFVGRA